MKRATKLRNVGWLAVAGLLGAAMVAPAGALATDIHQTMPISWDEAPVDCGDASPGPGEVVWHFVLTQPEDDSGMLTALFETAGEISVENADSPAAILHFYITTGFDSLLDASTDTDGGNLNLSHVCAGEQPSEEPSGSVEPSEEPSGSVEPSEEPSGSVEPSEEPSGSVEPSEEPSGSVEPSEEPSGSVEPSEEPTGAVEGEAGVSSVTPPPTDGFAAAVVPSGDTLRLLLVAMAGILASMLVLTPATKRTRR